MFAINQAGWERLARIALGIVLLALGWAGLATGGLGVALKILGFVPLTTGLIGWCPVYAVFGISTRGGIHRTRAAQAG